MSRFFNLEDYTSFVVQYRYKLISSDEVLARDEAIPEIQELLDHGRQFVHRAAAGRNETFVGRGGVGRLFLPRRMVLTLDHARALVGLCLPHEKPQRKSLKLAPAFYE